MEIAVRSDGTNHAQIVHQIYNWQWSNQTLKVSYDRLGQGAPILLLPAFSTVSSKQEWDKAAQLLALNYQVTCVDWPGFGESSRPTVAYNPIFYKTFLQDFVLACFDRPIILVAAGHSAGYALTLAQQLPSQILQLVLVAPTWRGPLPTMGAKPAIARSVEKLVRSPLVGQFLYYLNTRPGFLQWMYRRHVFSNPANLTSEFMVDKYRTTQQRGARFGPAAFVTGGLDPVTDRDAFLRLFQGLQMPCSVITSQDGPPKSKAEMEAIAQVPQVQMQQHPGSLGLHEEFGSDIAGLIQVFLQA